MYFTDSATFSEVAEDDECYEGVSVVERLLESVCKACVSVDEEV